MATPISSIYQNICFNLQEASAPKTDLSSHIAEFSFSPIDFLRNRSTFSREISPINEIIPYFSTKFVFRISKQLNEYTDPAPRLENPTFLPITLYITGKPETENDKKIHKPISRYPSPLTREQMTVQSSTERASTPPPSTITLPPTPKTKYNNSDLPYIREAERIASSIINGKLPLTVHLKTTTIVIKSVQKYFDVKSDYYNVWLVNLEENNDLNLSQCVIKVLNSNFRNMKASKIKSFAVTEFRQYFQLKEFFKKHPIIDLAAHYDLDQFEEMQNSDDTEIMSHLEKMGCHLVEYIPEPYTQKYEKVISKLYKTLLQSGKELPIDLRRDNVGVKNGRISGFDLMNPNPDRFSVLLKMSLATFTKEDSSLWNQLVPKENRKRKICNEECGD